VIRNRTEKIASYIFLLDEGGGLMEKEALRNVKDRRSVEDRRMFNEPDDKGPELRRGEDRRFLGDRRSTVDCQTILSDFLRID
jgi:hypothetical protein